MSAIAGIDYDSNGIYIVEVDEDDGAFLHAWKRELFVTNGETDTSFNRARHVRDALPPSSIWDEANIVAVGIEDPYSRFPAAIKAEARIQGAILARLPKSLQVYPFEPHTKVGWKGRTIGKTNASKAEIAAWARTNGAPPAIRQDFYDAFCIARAAREVHDRQARIRRAADAILSRGEA